MADAKSQIAFEELGLGSLLKRYHLRVPANQREYSWTDRETRQLLQDFARAINEPGPYFLGTVVTIPRQEGTLEVVDGQQRLATTAILLAELRNYLKTQHEDVVVDSINNEFLSGIDREKRSRVPKLQLNVDDNELFSRIITGEPIVGGQERASHQRLLTACDEARSHVKRIVAPLDTKAHGDLLVSWISFIEHRALVVLLRVPNDADAYKMFETLNDRGLRTSQADLIKNFLFSRAGARIAEVQSRWSYMRGALESASDSPDITITFLRHALVTQRGHLRDADVYDAVQEIVKSEPATVTFSATIENLANIYVATFNPEHERWNPYPDAARRAIEVFALFDIKPMRPLILAIAAKMEGKEASAVFKFLVALSVRLIIASSTRTSSVEIPLADAAKKVFEGSIANVAKLKEFLTDLIPSDVDFRESFESARVSNAKLARYYLRSLEMAAKDESEPWFIPHDDRQVINLEHILPRKPEANWPQFDEHDVARLTNRLGNLALMRASDNSQLKSQSFADKKQIYESSPYVLTSQVADLSDWTATTIVDRQKSLAELALKTWATGA